MHRVPLSLRRWIGPRLRGYSLSVVGLSLFGLGCAQFRPSAVLAYRPPRGATLQGIVTPLEDTVVQASAFEPADLPPTTPHPVPTAAPEVAPEHGLPIGLDTVLRLAEEQNPQIALARERVNEAFIEEDMAGSKWLPDLYVGSGFYRHEGGIQNEDGTLTHSSFGAALQGLEVVGRFNIRDLAFQKVNAQRQVWQQKGELSKVTSETLLDASQTYIDFLTARTGEGIAGQLEKELNDLLERAEKLASVETGARVEVARIRAEVAGQERAILKLRQQSAAAQAKLIYLLGLDPCAQLQPMDRRLLPFDLVDATPPACDLVAQALANGPGVQELQGLVTLIEEAIERAKGPQKFLPVVQVGMVEGAFSAGPGDEVSWDNRWDLGLQARWNLTEFLTERNRLRAAQSKAVQAHLAYQDLRGKLTLGVQESRDEILSNREEIRRSREQIDQAQQAMNLSKERLTATVAGSSPSEVLLAIESLGRAQVNYLSSINAFDKAQLQLMVLLGPGAVIHGRR